MMPKGYITSYSGLVIIDEYFPNNLISTYITVSTTGGSIVYENLLGEPQYKPNAFVGYNYIAARRILSSATIDGVLRTTTASILGWDASGNV